MLSSECWRLIKVSLKSFAIPESIKTLKWIPTLSEENLEDTILPGKKTKWKQYFFPRTCCSAHKKHNNRELGLSEEEFRCSEMLCLCSKTYCCYDQKSNKYKFSSKGLNKRTLEDCGDGPVSKYCKVLQKALNVISNNRGFRTIQQNVATYEQTKKDCLTFFQKNSRRRWNTHKTLTLVSFDNSFNCWSMFIHYS